MKTALVTGSAKRIGKAIAERLLSDGFRILVHGHSSIADLKAWVLKSTSRHQVIDIISANLATKEGQDHLVDCVQKSVKSLDLLVHNASAFSPKAFSDIDRKIFQEMLAINLEAPFFITQQLLPLLNNAPSPSVINILDAMWERPSPKYSHYAVSKAGLAILTRSLAIELAPHIRVNAVAPGAILFQPFHSDKARLRTLEHIPHKKLGHPSDIAEAVIYLSEHAPYATGHILAIDGGRSIAA